MRSIKECIVCSGTSFKTLVESTFSGTPLEAAPFFLANRRDVVHGQIQRCRTCGFTFTNPQFSADDYNEIYKNVPKSSDSEASLREADTQRFRRLAKIVRDDVGKFDRFLDFGCGNGGFLLAMDDPAGVGFELGEAGALSIGPSQVKTGHFLELVGTEGFEKGSFDLITSFYVFEHLPDLDKYVEALSFLLKPRGHLVIGVPNAASWNARLSGSHWNNYLLEHLSCISTERPSRDSCSGPASTKHDTSLFAMTRPWLISCVESLKRMGFRFLSSGRTFPALSFPYQSA